MKDVSVGMRRGYYRHALIIKPGGHVITNNYRELDYAEYSFMLKNY